MPALSAETQRTRYVSIHYVPQPALGGVISIIPMLQRRKRRHREVEISLPKVPELLSRGAWILTEAFCLQS